MVFRYSCTRVESGGNSYCCDFDKLIIKYHDEALILPEFLFMKTVREVKNDPLGHFMFLVFDHTSCADLSFINFLDTYYPRMFCPAPFIKNG